MDDFIDKSLPDNSVRRDGPMDTNELIFWLGWYRALCHWFESGRGSVLLNELGGYDHLSPAFGPAVLNIWRLHILLDQAYAADEESADSREDAWPSPLLPEEARETLRRVVRSPLDYDFRDPYDGGSRPGAIDPRDAMGALHQIVKNANDHNSEIPAMPAMILYDSACTLCAYLRSDEIESALKKFNLSKTVFTPFVQWIGKFDLHQWRDSVRCAICNKNAAQYGCDGLCFDCDTRLLEKADSSLLFEPQGECKDCGTPCEGEYCGGEYCWEAQCSGSYDD